MRTSNNSRYPLLTAAHTTTLWNGVDFRLTPCAASIPAKCPFTEGKSVIACQSLRADIGLASGGAISEKALAAEAGVLATINPYARHQPAERRKSPLFCTTACHAQPV